jgi:hypothetical protein
VKQDLSENKMTIVTAVSNRRRITGTCGSQWLENNPPSRNDVNLKPARG